VNRKWPIAGACAVVAAIALYLTFFRASDKDKIERCLADFAAIVTVKPNDTILSRTARMRSRMGDVARDDVQVTVSELHLDVAGARSSKTTRRRSGSRTATRRSRS
jgi:hypothetical protein